MFLSPASLSPGPSPVPILRHISPALLPCTPDLSPLNGPSCLRFLIFPPCLFFLTSPQVWERPVALEAELILTLKVLETMADRPQGGILDQPLHTLRHIHSELQACVSARGSGVLSVGSGHRGPHLSAPGPASHTTLLCPQVETQPTAGPQPQGRLHHWLHRLSEASKKVSDSRGMDAWALGKGRGGCPGNDSMFPFHRSLKAASRPLSSSTSSASLKRTWNVSPVETCVSEDLDPPPAHLGPQTLFMH